MNSEWNHARLKSRCSSPVTWRMEIHTLLCIVWPHTDASVSSHFPFSFFIWSLSCTQSKTGSHLKWQRPRKTWSNTPGSRSDELCANKLWAGRYLWDVWLMETPCVSQRLCRGPLIICIVWDRHFDSSPTTAKFMPVQSIDRINYTFSTSHSGRYLIFVFSILRSILNPPCWTFSTSVVSSYMRKYDYFVNIGLPLCVGSIHNIQA